MRSRFEKTAQLFGILGFRPLLVLLAVQVQVRAADPYWINTGNITNPPQIDAINFLNLGQINISTDLPFQTADTLNYTNNGFMSCDPGWRFDNYSSLNGLHKLSANFVNQNRGTVESLDPQLGVFFLGQQNLSTLFPSYLWVNSTNIINSGLLSDGANGWMQLVGTNITVRNSGLEITTIQPLGSFNVYPTNFFPDVGISDVWWGEDGYPLLGSTAIWNGTTARTPTHTVTNGAGFTGNVGFSVSSGFFQYISNAIGTMSVTVTNNQCGTKDINIATNIILQAVFVGWNDFNNISADIHYFPSTSPTNFFQGVAVQFAIAATNVITASPDVNFLYFYDTLGSETNRGILTNVLSSFTSRPANYLLARADDGRFAGGQSSANGVPPKDFLCQKLVTTTPFPAMSFVVTNCLVDSSEYSGYNAFIDNQVTEPPSIPPGTVTNLPGRIRIYGNSLDMTKTRVRGEGEVMINVNHLLSSDGAAVDCENLSYFLGNTNGALKVQNLAQQSVMRLNGNLLAWSGLWTNTMQITLENYNTNGDPSNVMCSVRQDITNFAGISYHVLILDANQLLAFKPVLVHNLTTHSTNVTVNDTMTLVQSLLIDGVSFTLNGALTFGRYTFVDPLGLETTTALTDWTYTNTPNLLYFTNNGTITIPGAEQGGTAHFGDDRAFPYQAFVNTGSISAASISVNSAFFQNSGSLGATVGSLSLVGGTGKLEAGQSTSAGDTLLQCSSAKLNKYHLASGGGLYLAVPGPLFDGGGTSSNTVTVQYGFDLAVKPASGDLLGTSFQTTAPDFVEIDHYWAGLDYGVSNAGYSNNVALGKLVVGPAGRAPLFYFAGTGAQNGLYVDLLDLSSLGTNFQSLLEIDPSLTIYFAAAKLGFTPPNNQFGVPQEPEEYLDGQFGGHLRWVSSFVGPNSSVDVIINGQTVSVNRALRFSKIIDSNGNGVPNYYDPYPFNSPAPTLVASVVSASPPPAQVLAISWTAVPNSVYQVQYTTNMPLSNWKPLLSYTNNSANSANMTAWDTNAPAGSSKRFYRVRQTQ